MKFKDFYIGIDGNYSYLNFDINIREVKDKKLYSEFMITDEYEYRLDKISKAVYGVVDYGIFIMLANRIKSINELVSGRVLIIPNLSVIEDIKYRIRKEKL
jgi:hypothetical protein